MDIFALLLSLAFALGLTYGAWRAASFSWMLDFKTSTVLRFPMWILQGLMVAGGVLLALATLRDLIMVVLTGSAPVNQLDRSMKWTASLWVTPMSRRARLKPAKVPDR